MASNAVASVARLELLSKDNFDTSSMQVEALLVKNDLWEYVNGTSVMPNEEGETKVKWLKANKMAQADLIIFIHPTEVKQVRGCNTSREVWTKLESIYSSEGPARKPTLLKQLFLQRLEEGCDVKDQIAKFFDIVDKLESMQVHINGDLLSIMLLYSLPKTFENFRCAIECRDELPTADLFKIKLIEEAEARKNASVIAMTAHSHTRSAGVTKIQNKPFVKIRCFKCGQIGHKANVCNNKQKKTHKEKSSTNNCNTQSYAAFHTDNETAGLAYINKMALAIGTFKS